MSTQTPLEKRLERHHKFEKSAREYRSHMQTSVGGLEVGLSVVVGALLGFLFDHNFDSLPWGTLVGLCFGMFAGGRQLYRIAKKYQEQNKDE